MHGREGGLARAASPAAAAGALGLVAVVTGLTVATRVHALPLKLFAASAAQIASGKVWLLATSALVVDRPVLVGLIAFGAIGSTALWCCGSRTFWLAAVVGHTGSTLVVYAIIGSAQLFDRDTFAREAVRPDFGVSAMQAAWVGAITATAWLRAGTARRDRSLVALATCAIGGIAWWLHPDPSILTTEHLFAFLIGFGIVAGRPRWSLARAPIVLEG